MMKTKFNDHYAYRVSWADDDQEYVATCAKFPSLSWLDITPEKALVGIRKVVAYCVIDLQKTRARAVVRQVFQWPICGARAATVAPPSRHRSSGIWR